MSAPLVASALAVGGCVGTVGNTDDVGRADGGLGVDGAGGTDGRETGDGGDPGGTLGDGAEGDAEGPAGDAGGTHDEVVHLFGRFDRRDPLVPECAWTSCGVAVTFRGTGLDVELSGAGGIGLRVVLDGVPGQRLVTQGGEWGWQETASVYTVVAGLADTEHTVELWREPEAMFGPLRFHGFVPAGNGALLASPRPYDRRIEIVGDSISAGYGNLGCPFSAATEDGFAGYGPVAARALGAEIHVEAWSGRGMARNYDGSTDGLLPELYDLALPDDGTSQWNHVAWVPDAVVINLGTNDFNGGVNPTTYVAAYTAFVSRLRGLFPNALILCAINNSGDSFSAAIDEVLADVADARVLKINLDAPNWNGCNGHPDVVADQAMGASLAARLQLELGW
jgi:lysophospholipase L1-like esterase